MTAFVPPPPGTWRGNTNRGMSGRFVTPHECCPGDFDETLIRIGRLGCEAHYGVGRKVVTRWLEERGKDVLIAKRAEFVEAKQLERRNKITRREFGLVLSRAYPIEHSRLVSPELARKAADYLRIVRNGGFVISPSPHGDWWVGLARRSSEELLDLAKERGFNPSLTGEQSGKVD
jgi:hypothetical protein